MVLTTSVRRFSMTLLLLLTTSAILTGCSTPSSNSAQTARAGGPSGVDVRGGGHNAFAGDVFDATPTAATSMTLADAEAVAASGIAVPTDRSVGPAVRAWSPGGKGGPKERAPLAVLYSTGIKFFAFPESFDTTSADPKAVHFSPYTDGRAPAFNIQTVAGVRYEVEDPGVQILPNGESNEVVAAVTFHRNGVEYEIVSPRSSQVSTSALLQIAESIR